MADQTPEKAYERRQAEMRKSYHKLFIVFSEVREFLHRSKEEKTWPEVEQYVERLTQEVASIESYTDVGNQLLPAGLGTLFRNCKKLIQHLETAMIAEKTRREARLALALRRRRAVEEAATVAFRNICRRLAIRDMHPNKMSNPTSMTVMGRQEARQVVLEIRVILTYMDPLTEEQGAELIRNYIGRYPGMFANFWRGLSGLRADVEEVLKEEPHTVPDAEGKSQEGDPPLPREWGGS